MYVANRYIWELARGPIPPGMFLCHICDTPSCVNPDHMFVGTQKENIADRDKKGRQVPPKGEKNGSAKLAAQDIIAIRGDARLQKAIAIEYGVDRSVISEIKSRKAWRHIQ